MCEVCDTNDAAVKHLRMQLWGAALDALQHDMHPADVLASLGLLIASIVAGGDSRFDQFEDVSGETGREALVEALFDYTRENYEELKEVADEMRAQATTSGQRRMTPGVYAARGIVH